MDRFQDRQVLCKILHESIVQMCKVSVGLHNNITIDGIICIANEEDDRDVVVKIHEQIERNTSSEIRTAPAAMTKQRYGEMKQQSQLQEVLIEKTTYQERPQFLQSQSVMSDKDFIFQDDNELFGDIAAIKAITPLNRNDTYETVDQPPPMESVVNLIDEETVSYSEAESAMGLSAVYSDIQTNSQNSVNFNENAPSVLVKPDPGPACATLITQEDSSLGNTSCTVTSVLDTRPTVSCDQSLYSTNINYRSATEESDDDDLKIEKLKAGRVRKQRRINSESSGQISPEPGSMNLNASAVCEPNEAMDTQLVQFASPEPVRTLNVLGTITQSPPVKVIPSKADQPNKSLVSQTFSEIKQMLNEQSISVQETTSSSSQQTPKQQGNIVSKDVQETTKLKSLTDSQKPQSLTKDKPVIVPTGITVSHQLELMRSQQAMDDQEKQAPSEETSESDHANIPITISNIKEVFTCFICNSNFKPFKKYHLHMFKIHAAFPCPCCDKMFKHRISRNRHIVSHHAGTKAFVCPVCKKKYVRADTLKLHIQKSHPGRNYKVNFSYGTVKQIDEPDTTNPSIGSSNKKKSVTRTKSSATVSSTQKVLDEFGEAVATIANTNASQSEATNTVAEQDISACTVSTEPDVVFNKNLPRKFEVESDNSSDATSSIHTRIARSVSSSQAAIVSMPGPCYVIPGMPGITFLSQTVDTSELSDGADELMRKFEEDETEDIMDMIEISDEEMEKE